jgi:hypothetical protein
MTLPCEAGKLFSQAKLCGVSICVQAFTAERWMQIFFKLVELEYSCGRTISGDARLQDCEMMWVQQQMQQLARMRLVNVVRQHAIVLKPFNPVAPLLTRPQCCRVSVDLKVLMD